MKRFDLDTWLSLIEKHRGTTLLVPPPVVLAVVKSPSWEKYRLDSVRSAGCGAAPLGADLQAAFEERTGLVMRQIWGMTEGTAILTGCENRRDARTLGACGYLAPSLEARVVDVALGGDRGPG